ncbi:cytokine-dependent hematopoietic cell linker [Silurus asotus]|uniref:Cytokine-dependent hematopoietic cell linker n=1 Tax=Silurus asotus TaxID=30991 RepID=A0AAD5FU74_SILAS|nr:cytokine-dependent hematopoietic cell linker [Silurus asotus]
MDHWNRGGLLKQPSDNSDESDYHEPEEPIMRFPRPSPSPPVFGDDKGSPAKVSNSRLTGLRSGSAQRHSLDLETHEQDKRYFTEGSAMRDMVRQMHREWPQEGAFLVRDCSRNTKREPYVLAIFYDNRVFNVQIRFCMETCKYTLGTRIKNDETFGSVAEIIKFHSIFPIFLIDGRNPSAVSNQKRQCVLMYPVTADDMRRLLI